MPIHLYDPAGSKWVWALPSVYDSTASVWAEARLPASPAVTRVSMFDPYIAAGTVFTRDVRGSAMPLAANSAANADWIATHINAGSGFGPTSLNTSAFGTRPIATFVVDSTAPGCDWQYMDSCAGADPAAVRTYLTGRIPLPLWAHPAVGGDQGLALYDLGTGIMREYFMVNPVSGAPGHWTAATGGYSLANPQFVDLATTNYGAQLRTGSSAVVGMHNSLGFLGIAELLQGELRHAVAFTCANMGVGPSWPARASDGLSTDAGAPREGQWCRLPASVDPLNNPATGKPYNPLTQVIIRAFQRYGGFASDKNLFVHAFNGEDGQTWAQLFGEDPWYRDPSDESGASDGSLIHRYGNSNRTIDVGDFPWDQTEWAPVDWGRPSPDFVLRPSETAPWVQ